MTNRTLADMYLDAPETDAPLADAAEALRIAAACDADAARSAAAFEADATRTAPLQSMRNPPTSAGYVHTGLPLDVRTPVELAAERVLDAARAYGEAVASNRAQGVRVALSELIATARALHAAELATVTR